MTEQRQKEDTIGSTEWLLIERATRGDGSAFTGLYETHVKQVYRYVAYRVTAAADAEDITQEVFLRAWRKIKAYKVSEKPFLAWLYTIAHNLVVDWYRSKGRTNEVSVEEAPQAQSLHTDPDTDYILDQQVVRGVLKALPSEQQQVLMLRFVEGFDYPQVAATLGKSQGAIRVIQLRALRRLRTMLEEGTG